MPYAQIAGAIVVLLSWCLSASGQPGQPTIQRLPPADMAVVSLLGPGVNFGNMLEGPEEGAWGFFVEERFFDAAVDSGMKHIRLPVSWTHHTAASPPYTIDPVFMDRVEWCVDQALARGLRIIVNNHHYDELHADPLAESARSLAIWRQVAERFADRPNRTVFFEVLNEPHGAFNDNPALWDVHLAEALGVIRESNPGRWVLAGPVRWNSIAALDSFNPPDDPRLMLSVHHYEPFEFTHQGAEWVDPSPPVGTDWTGNEHVIASPWQNWSWDTLVGPADRGLSIAYQQGWAGLSFRRGALAQDVTGVRFTVDRAMSLSVIIGNGAQQTTVPIQTTPGVNEYLVTLPAGMTTADRVTIQNATPNPQAPFVLSQIVLDAGKPGTTEPLILTQRDAVEASLQAAADWGRVRGIPVHLGEFGAYHPADTDSRARWTRAVRASAERHGIAWAYWELTAGFGYFDPETDAFREPLLETLTD